VQRRAECGQGGIENGHVETDRHQAHRERAERPPPA
jgi:hypothetical protein